MAHNKGMIEAEITHGGQAWRKSIAKGFLHLFGTVWFASTMYAIQAQTMPAWGPIAIGGTAWMMSTLWVFAIEYNTKEPA